MGTLCSYAHFLYEKNGKLDIMGIFGSQILEFFGKNWCDEKCSAALILCFCKKKNYKNESTMKKAAKKKVIANLHYSCDFFLNKNGHES